MSTSKKERQAAIEYAVKELGENVEVIDSFFENAPHDAKPLWFLGKSFELLSGADVALFIGEWNKYRDASWNTRPARPTASKLCVFQNERMI